MKHIRRTAAVTGGAVAALALAGTGTAFAWKPSDASLEIGCRTDAGHVELVLGNRYKAAGDYTLSLVGGSEVHRGRIEANATVKVTVGYSGQGDTWRYTLADTHVDRKVADVPLCPSATPTPTGTPSVPAVPTPSPTATPTPSGTRSVPPTPAPTATAPVTTPPSSTPPPTTPPPAPTTPAAVPSASPTPGTTGEPALAQTGGGDNTPLALAGGAVLAAGAGLVLVARRAAARRRA
ncbi:LPXTG cell wall anchor domain-containing protein [Kitasatospora sp. NPDC057692]|uniref:LPXTG cell wall anchor domain-containing protein n=1 Tax=Kitasatospora sp. NPDC057692 TaxID=3346215 RepID=UPI0036CFFD33